MAQPYIGEIRMFAGNFAPVGWAFCDGQLLSINEYETLFVLIGTTYGGDGEGTFALPDLRGRLPIHQGAVFNFALSGGEEQVTLTVPQLPMHTHPLRGAAVRGNKRNPKNTLFSGTKGLHYAAPGSLAALDPQAMAPAGGTQPHDNMQPYLCVNFIISLYGIFPNQN